VDGLVTGSVTRAGDRIRVTANLVHSGTGAIVWANRYDARTDPALRPALTPLFYVLATLGLAILAGRREPMQLLAAVITIVSGSVVFYAFGLHKRTATVR
jgi:Mn2+/Fe2+ NRAMP family transporter